MPSGDSTASPQTHPRGIAAATLAERVAEHFAASAELKRVAAAELSAPIARAIETMAKALRALHCLCDGIDALLFGAQR